MNIDKLYKLFLQYPSISTDTRKIIPNSIFFALKGDNFDGNKFASQALESGSTVAVVDDPEVVKDERYFLVNSVLEALQKLANKHRTELAIPIIGITGTNGKTTTKELTAAILSKKYKISFTQGNLNNHIGVPLTILKMTKETEIGIVEMGASHPGEIAELCRIAQPDYGLITNVGKAHLEGFGSFEGVKKTKAELYRSIEKGKGKIFINKKNEILLTLAGNELEKVVYGEHNDTPVNEQTIQTNPFLKFKTTIQTKKLSIQTNLIGNYNLENALAAACIGNYFGVLPEDIQIALEEYSPKNNRSQFIKKDNNQIVMDAYNANPTSMQTSIQNFLSLQSSSKILILGDMLELGQDSKEEHQRIVDLIRAEKINAAYIVGKNFEVTNYVLPIKSFSNSDSLIEYLQENPPENCLILIKGSRGIRLEKVLDYIN